MENKAVAADIQRKHLNGEATLSTQAAVGRWGALDLHKEAMQHANRKGRAPSSGSGDLGLSPSWSLVKYTHDLEIKCVNQMRDHPPVIHRAAGESEPCT